MAKKLGGLGKGLNAIFIENDSETEGGTVTLKISEIEPNRTQPRKEFDEQALSEPCREYFTARTFTAIACSSAYTWRLSDCCR